MNDAKLPVKTVPVKTVPVKTARKVLARGLIALLGYPNVGKSTLLNRLAGKKLAITTHKAQTTRSVLYHNVQTQGEQIIFIDTPGLFMPDVSRALYQSAWGAVQEADIILLLTDGRNRETSPSLLQKLKHWEKPIAIGINKIDSASEEQVFKQTQGWSELLPNADIFQISAKRGTGLVYLQKELLQKLPSAREISIHALDDFHQAAEITREKILIHIHDELPWQAKVKTQKITCQKGALKIEQVICVPEARHRAIFIGKSGEKIKTIGEQARKDMMGYFNKKVHLFIRVEVESGVA